MTPAPLAATTSAPGNNIDLDQQQISSPSPLAATATPAATQTTTATTTAAAARTPTPAMTPSHPPAAPPSAPAAAATSWGVATTAQLLASTGGVPWTPGLLGLTYTPDQDTSSHLFLNLPHYCPFSYSILFSSLQSLLLSPLFSLPSLQSTLSLL